MDFNGTLLTCCGKTGPFGNILTFVYSEIWNLSTVFTKNQLTAVNLLSV